LRSIFIIASASGAIAILGVFANGRLLIRSLNLIFNTSAVSLAINDRMVDHLLLEDLSTLRRNGLSFYTPQRTLYHRLLQHTRLGDGHPAMAISVLTGDMFRPMDHLPMFSRASLEDRCHAVRTADKDVIVLERKRDLHPNDLDGPVEACLAHAPAFRRSTFAALAPMGVSNAANLDEKYILFHRVREATAP
jgi:hypothetical protein